MSTLKEFFTIPLHRTWPWSKALYLSFRRYFPDAALVVVDQNPKPHFDRARPQDEVESRWFANQSLSALLVNRGGEVYDWHATSHGQGIDRAAAWGRENGYHVLIHLDGDSLIRGIDWYDAMRSKIEEGFYAVSGERRWHGYAGLSPSMWRIDKLQTSFLHVKRGKEMEHPRIEEVIAMSKYLKTVGDANNGWFRETWDTAQKIWFEAALCDKAHLFDGFEDFIHFGAGGRREMKAEEKKLLAPYLDETDLAWRITEAAQ